LQAEFAAMGNNKLSTEVATRQNVAPWLQIYDALPNPDPVLRKTSSRIEILDEIKREPHVSACSKSRKAGVLKRLWKIEQWNATPAATEIIDKLFQNLPVRTMIREMLDGWGYGYKPLEILWQREGNLLLPFTVAGKPPEWFCFGENNELRLRRQDTFTSDEVEPYKFLLARYEASYSNPYGEAQYSLSFWPTTFKKGGIKCWAIFLEKFGMPHVIGKLPRNAGNPEREELTEALSNMVRDAIAVVPDDASVELLEQAAGGTGSSDIYERHARYHDGEISKCILGHAAAADSTPGRLGNETGAMDVRSDIIDDDSSMVMETMDMLIHNIFELNPTLGQYRPRFELYEEDDVDTARADRDAKLLETGQVRLTKKYFTRRYDYDDDEIEVIVPQQTPAATPAAEFAAPPAATDVAQERVDDLLTGITPTVQQRLAEALLDPVVKLINESGSYADVQKNLTAQFSKMDDTEIVATLEKAMLLANVAGAQPRAGK